MRGYGDIKDPMDLETVKKRVWLVLNLYDKIQNEKVRNGGSDTLGVDGLSVYGVLHVSSFQDLLYVKIFTRFKDNAHDPFMWHLIILKVIDLVNCQSLKMCVIF